MAALAKALRSRVTELCCKLLESIKRSAFALYGSTSSPQTAFAFTVRPEHCRRTNGNLTPINPYASLVIALGLSAIPAFAAQSDQGILEIQIKDHRDAIDDFAKLNITIDKISISPKSSLKIWQTGWKELTASADTVDLTKYTGKRTARVFRGAIDAGAFDAFHLKLKSIDGVLKKNQKTAPVKNTVGPVKLPFNVAAKGETILIIDVTVTDMSDHPPRGYELEIHGYELFTNGKLIQKVPPG